MKQRRYWLVIGLCLLVMSMAACYPRSDYKVPEATEDGWLTATLQEVGMDEKHLQHAVDKIRDGDYEAIHSILIVKDGRLVFEEYFSGYSFLYSGENFHGEFQDFDTDTIHNLGSVTKIITSTLIGLAIDHGFIQSVEEGVFQYFPEYSEDMDKKKVDLQVEHFLTMTSGLEWNQLEVSITDIKNDLVQMWVVEDPIGYVLNKPLLAEPGERWYYSEGDVNVLGEVIQSATGLMLDEFAREYLFEPLGIQDYEWNYVNSDMVWASGDLKLRPRDMAKIGWVYLNGGLWNRDQILSEEWVEASTRGWIEIPYPSMAKNYGDRYGYHWWRRNYRMDATPVDVYLRTGWGGQAIIVFPDLEMVAIFTGGNYAVENYMAYVHEIVERYILPAVQ